MIERQQALMTDSGGPARQAAIDLKLRAIRTALTYSFPTADIEQMNEEIEQGYRDESMPQS